MERCRQRERHLLRRRSVGDPQGHHDLRAVVAQHLHHRLHPQRRLAAEQPSHVLQCGHHHLHTGQSVAQPLHFRRVDLDGADHASDLRRHSNRLHGRQVVHRQLDADRLPDLLRPRGRRAAKRHEQPGLLQCDEFRHRAGQPRPHRLHLRRVDLDGADHATGLRHHPNRLVRRQVVHRQLDARHLRRPLRRQRRRRLHVRPDLHLRRGAEPPRQRLQAHRLPLRRMERQRGRRRPLRGRGERLQPHRHSRDHRHALRRLEPDPLDGAAEAAGPGRHGCAFGRRRQDGCR